MTDNPDTEVYYPYNETAGKYGEPRAGKRARIWIEEQNKLKGGTWVLHTKQQYDQWYSHTGRHLETIALARHMNPPRDRMWCIDTRTIR